MNRMIDWQSLAISKWQRWFTIAIVLLVGCTVPFDGIPTEDTTRYESQMQVSSAREYLEEAWRLGREWRTDVELKQIRVNFAMTAMLVRSTNIDFTFESPSEDRVRFYVHCLMGTCSGSGVRIPMTSGWGAVDFDEDMIDSDEAALIAIQNGGAEYVDLPRAFMSLSLLRDSPRSEGSVVWEGYFADGVRKPLYVVIDPYTGDVLRIDQ